MSILVVDYNLEARSSFYEILSSLGHSVTCVPTGEEALAVLVERRPKLIVLDNNMPGKSSLQTLREIRSFDKDVRIVIISQNSLEKSVEEEMKNLGVEAVIKKDFSSHFMVKKILEVLMDKREEISGQANRQKERGCVLVVDDSEPVREVLWSFLSKSGYNVMTASSGQEAVMKIKVNKPQVVLLDIRMRGMDGLLVLKQIKRHDPSIKVVMLTSVQDEYVIEQAKEAGASDYLVKPCNFQELDVLISSLLFTGEAYNAGASV